MRPETRAKYPKDWMVHSARLFAMRGGTCETCGIKGHYGNPLTCHHIDYNPANNDSKNLICLCAACHLRRQNHERKYGQVDPRQIDMFGKVYETANA